ncbi:hypothetical protein [Pedobacter metabolipauper]|nr:hypothetical protein [Pedobacter metabolipauper]
MNMLYQHITHSELFSDVKKPNGKLCKIQRPANSDREDVVINGLGLDREEVQEGVFNVNVYVPNLKYPFGHPSFGDKSQPDTGRILYLNNLTNTALGTGEEIWNEAGTCCFNVQQDNVFEDSNNQHYINFRIEFYITN